MQHLPPPPPRPPTRQAIAARDRTEPGRVTGKLRTALAAMVWQGLTRPEAAQAAGMTDHGLREALRRPHVRAAYLAECEVLRTSGRARRIHRLNAMVEQDDNKAAVINAAIALERLTDGDMVNGRPAVQVPGMVIQIVTNGEPAIKTIEAGQSPRGE